MSLEPRKIQTLLVEDDPDLVEIASEMLRLYDCEITSAGDPEQALSKLAENSYDLLFTDYRFPSALNGIELANKAYELNPKMKIVIATGFDEDSIRSQSRPEFYILSKPFGLQSLETALQYLFSKV